MTKEQLLEKHKALQLELEQVKADLKTANTTIQTLQAEPFKSKPQNTVPVATYESETGHFEFTVKSFRYQGEKHLAEEAINKPELMAQLIEAKCSFLKPV